MECIPPAYLKWLGLRDKQGGILVHTPFVQLAMKLAPILAMAGVRLINVAVATFEFGENATFIHHTGATIICQRTE